MLEILFKMCVLEPNRPHTRLLKSVLSYDKIISFEKCYGSKSSVCYRKRELILKKSHERFHANSSMSISQFHCFLIAKLVENISIPGGNISLQPCTCSIEQRREARTHEQ